MRGPRLAGAVLERAVVRFFAHGCTRLAAAISYYALFAVFPLAILAVAVFGLVVADDAARTRVIGTILDIVPLRPGSGSQDLNRVLHAVTTGAGVSGGIGVLALLITASGMMGAVRFALNQVWEVEDDHPPLRAKALEVLLVLAAGAVIFASLGLTVLVRSVSAIGGGVAVLAGELAPAVLAFLVFAALLRGLPARRPRMSEVWPGALIGAVGYAVAKLGFGIYLARITDLGAVYASLATVVAFLLFVWLSACLFLFGAEVSAAIPAVRAEPAEPGEPAHRRLAGWLRGLVLRPGERVGGSRRS
jgi:membrane protein